MMLPLSLMNCHQMVNNTQHSGIHYHFLKLGLHVCCKIGEAQPFPKATTDTKSLLTPGHTVTYAVCPGVTVGCLSVQV